MTPKSADQAKVFAWGCSVGIIPPQTTKLVPTFQLPLNLFQLLLFLGYIDLQLLMSRLLLTPVCQLFPEAGFDIISAGSRSPHICSTSDKLIAAQMGSLPGRFFAA